MSCFFGFVKNQFGRSLFKPLSISAAFRFFTNTVIMLLYRVRWLSQTWKRRENTWVGALVAGMVQASLPVLAKNAVAVT